MHTTRSLVAAVALFAIAVSAFANSANASMKTCTNQWALIKKIDIETGDPEYDDPVSIGNGWTIFGVDVRNKQAAAKFLKDISMPQGVEDDSFYLLVINPGDSILPNCAPFEGSEPLGMIRLPK